jgi:hypothetical protein
MKQIILSKTHVMKKTLSVITIAAVMAACNSNPQQGIGNATVSTVKVADTIGLAEYQAWKAQKEMADFNAYQQSKNAIASNTAAPVRKVAKTSPAGTVKVKKPVAQSGSGSSTTTTSYPAKAPEKKGWSKAAKGTAIGAGSGAVIGAVINKRNRAVGAVIGGVAGGAVGYGIGRHMDKKDGRY